VNRHVATGNHLWRPKGVYSFLATDERIVPDAGMTGRLESLIGVRLDAALIAAEGGRATGIEAFGVPCRQN